MSGSPPGSVSTFLLRRFHRWGVARSTGSAGVRLLRWASWGGFISMLVLTNPGARGHRLRALGRMWGWQIWRRVPGRPILVSFSSGTRLYFPPWSTLAGHVAATGSHEPSEQAFLAALVRPGDVAVDVGANIGIYTVALAGLGARVAAFEPGTEARSVLAHNIALNASTDHVEVFPFALGDRDGSALLTTALDGANHLEEVGGVAGSTEPVEIRTLDTIVEAHGSWFDGLGPLVVKIDAEGHDEEVLRGGRRLLERDRPVVMVEVWDGGHRIRAFLSELGYEMYSYDPEHRALERYPDVWTGQGNFLAVPDARLEEVRSRLAAAPNLHQALPAVRWCRERELEQVGTRRSRSSR